MQDGSKAAEGLALASNALDAAKPLVAKAEEAKKAADAARSEMRDISRYVLDPPLPLTSSSLHPFTELLQMHATLEALLHMCKPASCVASGTR